MCEHFNCSLNGETNHLLKLNFVSFKRVNLKFLKAAFAYNQKLPNYSDKIGLTRRIILSRLRVWVHPAWLNLYIEPKQYLQYLYKTYTVFKTD